MPGLLQSTVSLSQQLLIEILMHGKCWHTIRKSVSKSSNATIIELRFGHSTVFFHSCAKSVSTSDITLAVLWCFEIDYDYMYSKLKICMNSSLVLYVNSHKTPLSSSIRRLLSSSSETLSFLFLAARDSFIPFNMLVFISILVWVISASEFRPWVCHSVLGNKTHDVQQSWYSFT